MRRETPGGSGGLGGKVGRDLRLKGQNRYERETGEMARARMSRTGLTERGEDRCADC